MENVIVSQERRVSDPDPLLVLAGPSCRVGRKRKAKHSGLSKNGKF